MNRSGILPHIPSWRRYLSYLWPQHIKDFGQDSGQNLEIFLQKGYFQLAYGRVFYSDGLGYKPFRLGFAAIGFEYVDAITNVLFLGAGMGSGAHILQKSYPKSRSAFFVDTNNLILKLCEESVSHCNHLKSTFIEDDASNFLHHSNEKFDFIGVDVFDECEVPESILSLKFLEDCKKCLTVEGWLIMNLIFNCEEEWTIFYQKISRIFVVEHLLNAKGNKVIVAHI